MERKGFWRRRFLGLFVLTMLTALLCGMSVSAATKTVSMQKNDGVFIYEGQWSGTPTVYHKFKVKKSSFALVTGVKDGGYGVNVTLCNSKKKKLESKPQYVRYTGSESNSTYARYALTKGTYYIKTSGIGRYVILVAAAAKTNDVKITDQGGATRIRAKALSAGKRAYGIIGMGEKPGKSDWYRFTVTRSKVLNLGISAEGDGKVSFTLYGPSYSAGIKIGDLKDDEAAKKTVQTRYGAVVGDLKVKPGTYYIKVNRAAGYMKKSYSAVYSVVWK